MYDLKLTWNWTIDINFHSKWDDFRLLSLRKCLRWARKWNPECSDLLLYLFFTILGPSINPFWRVCSKTFANVSQSAPPNMLTLTVLVLLICGYVQFWNKVCWYIHLGDVHCKCNLCFIFLSNLQIFSVYAFPTYFTCIIHAFYILSTCILHILHVFCTCILHRFHKYSICILQISHMYSTSILHVFYKYSTFILQVSYMYSTSILHVFSKYATCFLHAFYMFGRYTLILDSPCIFLSLLQILRNHVMVRVGGGWDTLEHYLDKHDPCRCEGEWNW